MYSVLVRKRLRIFKNPVSSDNVINIVSYLQVNPHISTLCYQQNFGINRITVQTVLKQFNNHLFKLLIGFLTYMLRDEQVCILTAMKAQGHV